MLIKNALKICTFQNLCEMHYKIQKLSKIFAKISLKISSETLFIQENYFFCIFFFNLQGFGTLLMEEAARIAREEHFSTKIAVISGVGTRDYYRKLGYELDGPYMSKKLTDIDDD